jgi:formylglycine-generating enzyme required for sulfatase activity
MIRTMKNVAVFITALVLVAGMVSCENWMIEKLLERNEPSGGGGNGGGGGGSGGATVNVTEVKVYPNSLSLGLGESSTIWAQVIPGTATDQGIEWSSSDKSVVSVDNNGMVTALALGSATITAMSVNGQSAVCEVTVILPTVDKYIDIPGGTIKAGYKWVGGPFDSDGASALSDISVSAFHISRTEVRYELWYVVKEWGKRHEYMFENPGREGNRGGEGTIPTPTGKDLPVTTVSWRDVVVWCNAYSEITGKEPVYRNSGGDILRDSTEKTTGLNVEDLVDKTKIVLYNGYRLPTEREWEYAARGGVPSDVAGSAWEYKYGGTNTDEEVINFAWYSANSESTAQPVGQKIANRVGLRDMSGNVLEMCANLGSSDPCMVRGGSWKTSRSACAISTRQAISSNAKENQIGFRPVCRGD